MKNILQTQRNNATAMDFLRKSVCGYEGKVPKICCVLDSEMMTPNKTTIDKTEKAPVSNLPSKTQNLTTNSPNSLYSKLPSLKSCGRGRSKPSFRIIGGIPAAIGNFSLINKII